MRVAVAADEMTGVAGLLAGELAARGHEPLLHGALTPGERDDWAWAAEAAARDVADGRADQAVVCCWTGTGASIAANKVPGARAALCGDAPSAAGARRWNDANVLALSLRSTSEALLGEILDAWFSGAASDDASDLANVAHLEEIHGGPSVAIAPQLSVQRGIEAVEFYKRALGAVERYRVGGIVGHEELVCEMSVGEARFWVADESPEHANHSPESLGGGTVRMLLLVGDPAAMLGRAVAAGATEVRPVSEEHGWLLGRIADPYGHHWEIGRPLGAWPPG